MLIELEALQYMLMAVERPPRAKHAHDRAVPRRARGVGAPGSGGTYGERALRLISLIASLLELIAGAI